MERSFEMDNKIQIFVTAVTADGREINGELLTEYPLVHVFTDKVRGKVYEAAMYIKEVIYVRDAKTDRKN